MNIITIKSITNIIGMTSKLIKVWSVLFTIWKHGKYDDMMMPTVKELERLVGLTDKPIKLALYTLQKIRVLDRYQQSFPLLRISKKRINGRVESVYTLAAPEYGEITDPTCFAQDGGGSATMGALGGYFTLTDEIQKAVGNIGDQILIAALENAASNKSYNPDLYNYKTLHTLDMMKCMSDGALRKAIQRLKSDGYFVPSKAKKIGKYWGWEKIATTVEPVKEGAANKQAAKDEIEAIPELEDGKLDEYIEEDERADEYIDEPRQEEQRMDKTEEKVMTPEQMAPMKLIEMEKEETRKQRACQLEHEQEEVDFDWLVSQV